MGDRTQSSHWLNSLTRTSSYLAPPKMYQADLSLIKEQQPNTTELSFVQTYSEKPLEFPYHNPEYNPDKKPANLEIAQKFGQAHKITDMTEEPVKTDSVDLVTGLRSSNFRLSFFAPTIKLAPYGPVLPLFFTFTAQLMILLLLLAGYAVVLSVIFSENSLSGYQNFIIQIDTSQEYFQLLILSAFVILVLFFILAYVLRRRIKNVKLECKKNAVTCSDYALLIQGIKEYTPEDITKYFTDKMIPPYSLDLRVSVMAYDIKDWIKLIRDLNDAIELRRTADLEKNHKLSESCSRKVQEINKIFQQNKDYLKKFHCLALNGTCLLVYNSKQEAKTIRRKFEYAPIEKFAVWFMWKCTEDFPEHFFKNRMLKVEKAPDVNEIFWENLNSINTSFWSSLRFWLIFSFNIALTSAMIYGVRTFISQFQNGAYSGYISWIIGFGIYITNEIMESTIAWTTRNEPIMSVTKYYMALIYRIPICQLINSAAPLYFLDVGYFHDQASGFAYMIFIISTFVILLPIIFKIISPSAIFKKIKRGSFVSKAQNTRQEDMNRTFLDPEIQIDTYFSNVIKIGLFTTLFYPFSPGVAIVGLIGIFVGYWVDKYNILYYHMIPTNLRSEIAEQAIEMLDYILLALGTGNYMFYLQNKGSFIDGSSVGLALSITGFILSIIYLTLPNKRISRACCAKKRNAVNAFQQPLVYLQAKEFLHEDYETSNPVIKNPRLLAEQRDAKKEIYQKFKEIGVLFEVPELVTLFEYAIKKPSFADTFDEKYHGPFSPYFSYPQNYKYYSTKFNEVEIAMYEKKSTAHDIRDSNIVNESELRDIVPIPGYPVENGDNSGSLVKDIMILNNLKKPEDRMQGSDSFSAGSLLVGTLKFGGEGNSLSKDSSFGGSSLLKDMSPIMGNSALHNKE